MAKKTKIKLTLVDQLNTYIDTNRNLFKAGNSMTWKQFRRKFNKFTASPLSTMDPANTRDSIHYIAMYTKLNKLLAKRGMYMVARDYYSSFEMLEKAAIPKKIQNYVSKSKGNAKAATTLNDGYRRYHTVWKKALTRAEALEVGNHIHSSVARISY